MAFTIGNWRNFLRNVARNAKDETEYSDTLLDIAILGIFTDFLKATHCVRGLFSQTLTLAGAGAFTVAGTGDSFAFHPEKILKVYIPAHVASLDRPSYEHVLEKQICNATATGKPRMIAFDSPLTGLVYPAPDVDYSAKIQWWQPVIAYDSGTATGWDLGNSNATGYTLNIPGEYGMQVISLGGAAQLQMKQPEQGYGGPAFQQYVAYRDMMRGAGNMGDNYIIRERTGLHRWR